MRRTAAVAWISISGCFVVFLCARATDMTSPNFKNFDSSFAPATFSESSSNFSIDGSIEHIVDVSLSSNFRVQHGVPIKDTVVPPPVIPPPPPSGGGGGGGGGGLLPTYTLSTSTPGTVVPSPTLVYRSPTFLSHQRISGDRVVAADTIQVNGSSNGVTLQPGLGWNTDFPIFVGYNDIRVQEVDPSGRRSSVIGGQIERMLIGDASRTRGPTLHHVVDDVDLSIFTRSWKKYDFFSDFNEDTIIDDADLSLLVSHWGITVDY